MFRRIARSCALQVKTDFCQRMLPLFIHDILLGDADGSWRQLLSTHIQSFFSQCCRPSTPTSRPTTPMLSDSGTKSDLLRPVHNKNLYDFWKCFCILQEHMFLVLTGNTDFGNQAAVDKPSLRSMLTVIDYLRQQARPVAHGRSEEFTWPSFSLAKASWFYDYHYKCSCDIQFLGLIY